MGKKCGRCSTRYCGPECQKQHWEEGGHDKLCRKIKKSGGAEQYHANKKYAESVTIAVEACAEDTKGQTCYICTQALHWKTKEGLVRMCACRGTAGLAHVSCLAEQAKILVADAEERNLDDDKWARWYTCSLCEQQYHGVVTRALGWACWKTYLGRPEADFLIRSNAMNLLGNGFYHVGHYEDALSVYELKLSMERRLGADEENSLITQGNIANSYGALGRHEQALSLRRDVYSGWLKLKGEEHHDTLREAENYANVLVGLERFEEAKSLMRKMIPVARRFLGESNEASLSMRLIYSLALCKNTGATLDDLREAVTTLEDTDRTARRVLGGAHPRTVNIERALQNVRAALAAREAAA